MERIPAEPHGAESAPRQAVSLTVGLLVVFIPLAFSDDILDLAATASGAWIPVYALVLTDATLFLLLALLMRISPETGPAAWTFWWAALVMTLLLDWVYFDLAGTVLNSVLYLVPQTLAFLAVAAASSKADWRSRFVGIGLPLLTGTFLAWVAQSLGWRTLTRTGTGETGSSELVNAEYFAQISQLLPLLLIALAAEARVFETRSTDLAASRARTVVVVVIVALAEVLALSVLIYPAGPVLGDLRTWHVYVAFGFSVDAVLVALVTLCLAFVGRSLAPARTGW